MTEDIAVIALPPPSAIPIPSLHPSILPSFPLALYSSVTSSASPSLSLLHPLVSRSGSPLSSLLALLSPISSSLLPCLIATHCPAMRAVLLLLPPPPERLVYASRSIVCAFRRAHLNTFLSRLKRFRFLLSLFNKNQIKKTGLH